MPGTLNKECNRMTSPFGEESEIEPCSNRPRRQTRPLASQGWNRNFTPQAALAPRRRPSPSNNNDDDNDQDDEYDALTPPPLPQSSPPAGVEANPGTASQPRVRTRSTVSSPTARVDGLASRSLSRGPSRTTPAWPLHDRHQPQRTLPSPPPSPTALLGRLRHSSRWQRDARSRDSPVPRNHDTTDGPASVSSANTSSSATVGVDTSFTSPHRRPQPRHRPLPLTMSPGDNLMRRAASGSTSDRSGSHSASKNHSPSANALTSTAGSKGNTNASIISPPPRAQISNASSSTDGGLPPSHDPSSGPNNNSNSNNNATGSSTTSSSSASSSTPTSTKEALSTLRERDARIAHLEREMSVMESEFRRELDRLSLTESETATFWQTKCSTLHQQFLRSDTELRLLRAEVEVRRGEREELRDVVEALRREVRSKDEEASSLRAQVLGLKEWVSTSTRSGDQTSDEVFAESMAMLGNSLQNWVIVNFRRSKIKLSALSEEEQEELEEIAPSYEDLASMAKVHLLQSIVSRILVDTVFSAYFVGLTPEQTQTLQKAEEVLSSYDPTSLNTWRSTTLTLLRNHTTHPSMQAPTATLLATVVSRTNKFLKALFPDTPSNDNPSRDAGLEALTMSAIDLARHLASQRAVFRANMPLVAAHQRVAFNPATMEDIGGEEVDEADELTGREVWCVAFPGIVKWGDESGRQMQFRNVISKARVLCRPEDG